MTKRLTTVLIAELAILIDDQNAHHDPSVAELAKWDSERLRGIEEQLALAAEHEAREALNPDRAMSEEAILKRKKREERRAREKANESLSTPLNTESVPDPPPDPSRTSHGSGVTVPRNSATPYTVHVPGTSSTFEWYALSNHSFTTLIAARDAGVWAYPETPSERARCAVFRDLWEQGYFLGGGIKFGGEYLVYPGRFVSPFVSSKFSSAIPDCDNHRHIMQLDILHSFNGTLPDLFLLRYSFITRGPIAISFPLCRICGRVSCSPPSANGDRGSWSARNWHKEGSLVMRVGRGQAGRHILFHRVGRIWVRPVSALSYGQYTRSVCPTHPSHATKSAPLHTH